MCPACIASAATVVVGAASSLGIAELFIDKVRIFFTTTSFGLFQKTKENSHGH
jgi:hypothetical protein